MAKVLYNPVTTNFGNLQPGMVIAPERQADVIAAGGVLIDSTDTAYATAIELCALALATGRYSTDILSGYMNGATAQKTNSGQNWNVRNVTHADSPVTANGGDWIRADASGGDIQINGPGTADTTWGVKRVSATALHNITCSITGGGNIDGVSSFGLQPAQYSANTFIGFGGGADVQS